MSTSGIQRWKPKCVFNTPTMGHDASGNWCRYEDHKALLSELDRSAQEVIDTAEDRRIAAESKFSEVEAERDETIANCERHRDTARTSRLDAESKLERLTQALKFYATAWAWIPGVKGGSFDETPIGKVKHQVAKEALTGERDDRGDGWDLANEECQRSRFYRETLEQLQQGPDTLTPDGFRIVLGALHLDADETDRSIQEQDNEGGTQ